MGLEGSANGSDEASVAKKSKLPVDSALATVGDWKVPRSTGAANGDDLVGALSSMVAVGAKGLVTELFLASSLELLLIVDERLAAVLSLL